MTQFKKDIDMYYPNGQQLQKIERYLHSCHAEVMQDIEAIQDETKKSLLKKA